MENKRKICRFGAETTRGIAVKSSKMSVYLPQEEKSKAPIKISFERDGMLYEGTAYYVRDVNDEQNTGV